MDSVSNNTTTVLPMTRSDGWIAIAFSINGEAHEAVLDTGAKADIVIPMREARRLGLLDGMEENLNPTGQPLCWIKSPVRFRVGPTEHVAESALAVSMDHINRRGKEIGYLLGQDFILRHKTEFDFSSRLVRLHPVGGLPAFPYEKAHALPYHLGGQYMLVHALIGKEAGWFVWDTGAPITLLFRDAFEKTCPQFSSTLIWSAEESALSGTARNSKPVVLENLELGNATITKPSVRVLEMRDVQKSMESGEGTDLLGHLGADIFGAAHLLIDPKLKVIWRV